MGLALLPGREVKLTPAIHPYTTNGLQVDVRDGSEWVEIGESGLDTRTTTGLAMGVGMDRLLMLRKGLDDIRVR